MNIFQKLLKVLHGKANVALEKNLDPIEQMLLLKNEFHNKVGQANEAKIKLKGELNFAEKELSEMIIEKSTIQDSLEELKNYVKSGNTLTPQDKIRGEKLLSKSNSMVARIKSQEEEIVKIKDVLAKVEKNTDELEIKLQQIKDKIEDAQRQDVTAKAVTSYAEALEIFNDDTSEESLDNQFHKLQKKVAESSARAEVAESKSETFDFSKNKSSLDDFLNS